MIPNKKVRRKLTEAQWAEAEALWSTGEFQLNELSERFGVRPETLSRRFKKNGIKKGEMPVAEAVKTAVQEAVIDDATVIANRIRETKEEHYKWSKVLSGMAMKEIADAKKGEKAIAVVHPNLKALQTAMQIVEQGYKSRAAILGIDNEEGGSDEVPELVISELTQDQVDDMRRQQEVGETEQELEEQLADSLSDIDEEEEEDGS